MRKDYYNLSPRVRIEGVSCIRVNTRELNKVHSINESTLYTSRA